MSGAAPMKEQRESACIGDALSQGWTVTSLQAPAALGRVCRSRWGCSTRFCR